MLGLTTVAIAGSSMEPTLRPGQWWLVHRTPVVRPGQIIVFWHPVRIDLLTVKRADHLQATGWWVLGDNPDASDDSRSFGPVAPDRVVGHLLLRYRPMAAVARTRR